MTISLKHKTVVVTGGAKRVGRAIAIECARAGANVAITFNTSRDEAQQLVDELKIEYSMSPTSMTSSSMSPINQQFAAFQCELSDNDEVQRLVGEIVAQFGRVDALVNNAAIFRRTPFETLTERDFDDHINANLKAPFLTSKHFGDIMLGQQSGAIVNIADIHGLQPLKNYIPYCASKAGLISLTESFAKALAPFVRVNCICPGTILPPSETQGSGEDYSDDMNQLVARIPLGRTGSPDDIAQTVVFLVGGPQFISGAVVPVDGAERLK